MLLLLLIIPGIVILVPRVRVGVSAISRVMAAIGGATVVGNRVQVVARIRHIVGGVVAHIQRL